MELKIHDFEDGNRSLACIICFPSHAAYEMPSSESAEEKLTIFANILSLPIFSSYLPS